MLFAEAPGLTKGGDGDLK